MRDLITTELLRKLPRGPVDIWDTKLSRFVLRVRANGKASYLASIGRGAWHTLGTTDVLSPQEARELARTTLGDAAKVRTLGGDPVAERQQRKKAAATAAITFETFLDDHYEKWATANQKRGAETVRRLRSVFAEFLPMKLTAITPWVVEKWRTQRLNARAEKRVSAGTVNSYLRFLKAALNKAVAWKFLPARPLTEVKQTKTDQTGRVRFLTVAEEQRLRAALAARDETRNESRARANAWRRERGYRQWPTEAENALTAIVILALNTGLRRGEIFQLRWSDLDLHAARLTVRGGGAKSGQTRYVPLNAEALKTVEAWRTASRSKAGEAFVFPGRVPKMPLDNITKAWSAVVTDAKLSNFTFHDLRHTFASNLVMAGVDLNTVRELLGHGDLKMTLRYAHLAPEHKAAAVARLLER